MKEWINKVIKRWVVKRYKRRFEKKVRFYNTIYVKKGKIREWRTFDMNGVRMFNIMK